MADIFALDVSMGKSYCVWYRGRHCSKEFSLVHTKTGFNNLLNIVKKAQKPILYFEATGIYSRVIEHFCEINNLRFCRLNPLELHLKCSSDCPHCAGQLFSPDYFLVKGLSSAS